MDKVVHINSIENVEEKNERTSDSFALKFLKIFNKKNIKIFILLAVGVIALVLCFGFKGEDNSSEESNINSSSGYISTMDYCKELENKLKDVLSAIDGAGTVSVMLSLDGSPELVYAKDTDETLSSNSSGTTSSSTSSSPIIVEVNGSPNALVLTEILPAVKGVIVVSSGAGNVAVKLNLLNAVTTLLDITTDQVTVLKGI